MEEHMSVTIRQATLDDARTTFEIFRQSIVDLGNRMGVQTITGADDPDVLEKLWERRRPLFEHLSRTAEHNWLAESEGRAVGYARSIMRDGVRQLTEFFVIPTAQSSGVGKSLLEYAFPSDDARRRVIIATTDSRAVARYLKTGVYPRFPIYYFSTDAQKRKVKTDLAFEQASASINTLDAIRAIDKVVIGYSRDLDHLWKLEQSPVYLYRRDNAVVGYGYTGWNPGPFALLDADDFPAVLAHAESLSVEHTEHNARFGVEVPLVNRAASDYLLAQGFKMDTFFANFMSDEPFGQYENYILSSPPFFS
jgi:GNAT superfamily N-acetyltransferase